VLQGFLLNGGSLLTYGTVADTLSGGNNPPTYTLKMTGGLLQMSADNTSAYGQLNVTGNMNWTGGTYRTFVGAQADVLAVSGNLTTTTNAFLSASGSSLGTTVATFSNTIDPSTAPTLSGGWSYTRYDTRLQIRGSS
jgi:hypothetical protein